MECQKGGKSALQKFSAVHLPNMLRPRLTAGQVHARKLHQQLLQLAKAIPCAVPQNTDTTVALHFYNAECSKHCGAFELCADTAHASICLEGLFWVGTEMHLPTADILHAAWDVLMGPHLAYTFAAATPGCLQHDRIPYSLAADKRFLHIVYASLQRGGTQKNINGLALQFPIPEVATRPEAR